MWKYPNGKFSIFVVLTILPSNDDGIVSKGPPACWPLCDIKTLKYVKYSFVTPDIFIITSVGNSISFDGSGADPSIDFTSTSSGKIYASFILKVTDLSSMDSSDYFGILRDDTGNYVSRLFIGFIDDATFKIGISNSSTLTQETSAVYNQDDVLFVVMSYDLDADTVSAWINPTLGGAEPTATLTEAAASAATNIVQFLFRQDNAGDTPGMTIDELRISSSWSDVSPSSGTVSTLDSEINGFNAYPNPVKGNSLTVTTSSTEAKTVNIFNVLGRKVFSQRFSSMNKTMDISGISSGVYIMKVSEGNNIATKKLIIE